MIAEDLRSRVDGLSDKERQELSAYLAKLALEKDADYWEGIRKRSNDGNPDNWVNLDDVKRGG